MAFAFLIGIVPTLFLHAHVRLSQSLLQDSSLCPGGPELAERHGCSGMPEDEATDKALYAKEPMGLAVLASRGLLMPNGL